MMSEEFRCYVQLLLKFLYIMSTVLTYFFKENAFENTEKVI